MFDDDDYETEDRLPPGSGFALVFVLAFLFWGGVVIWAVAK